LKHVDNAVQVVSSRRARFIPVGSMDSLSMSLVFKKVYIEKDKKQTIVSLQKNTTHYDPGYVRFRLLQTNSERTQLMQNGKLYECSQKNFVDFLRSGRLYSKHDVHTPLLNLQPH